VRLAQGFAPLYSRETRATKIPKALLESLYAEGMGTPLSAGGVRGVPSSPRTHAVALAYTARRIAIDLALRRATKDRFVGIRTRTVSQLLEKLLRVELPY
jgi:hypothetical protein